MSSQVRDFRPLAARSLLPQKVTGACLPRCEPIGSWGIPPSEGSAEAFQHAEERTGVMDDTDGARGKEDKLLRSLQHL